MGMGRMVEDCMVGKVVGIMVDSMVEELEDVVVVEVGFVGLALVVRYWRHMGSLGIQAEIRRGPPCRPLECSSLDTHFQTFYH